MRAVCNLMQHVVPSLVSRYEYDLRRIHFGDGRIPNHDPLRCANPRNICIQGVGFFARAHPEHALRRNIFSRAMYHLFQRRRELRIFLLQWLELVKQRRNYPGTDEKHKYRSAAKPARNKTTIVAHSAISQHKESRSKIIKITIEICLALIQSHLHEPQACTEMPNCFSIVSE